RDRLPARALGHHTRSSPEHLIREKRPSLPFRSRFPSPRSMASLELCPPDPHAETPFVTATVVRGLLFGRMTMVAYMHTVKPTAFRTSHRSFGGAANIKAPQLNPHKSKPKVMGVRLLDASCRKGSQLQSLARIDHERLDIDFGFGVAIHFKRLDPQIAAGFRIAVSLRLRNNGLRHRDV